MSPLLGASKLFTDPGHIVVVALPIIALVIYAVTRRTKRSSERPDVFDPTEHDSARRTSHGDGHGTAGHGPHDH